MSREFDPSEVEELIKQAFRLAPAGYFLKNDTCPTDIQSAINFVRSAAEAYSQRPDEEGWIQWQGGECPVTANTLVNVRYKKGGCSDSKPAEVYNWSHDEEECYPIIAYKVVKS